MSASDFSHASRGTRFGKVAFGRCPLGIALALIACQHAQSLDAEFESAARCDQEIRSSEGVAGSDPQSLPIGAFAKRHAAAAGALFVDVITGSRGASSRSSQAGFVGAIRGCGLLRSAGCQGALRGLVMDSRVDLASRDLALRELSGFPGVRAAGMYGDELLRERNPLRRSYLLVQMLSLRDLSVRRYLEEARTAETEKTNLATIDLGLKALERPEKCVLMSKTGPYGTPSRWTCRYYCFGLPAGMVSEAGLECSETVENPGLPQAK